MEFLEQRGFESTWYHRNDNFMLSISLCLFVELHGIA
jgi:hypothetical protein